MCVAIIIIVNCGEIESSNNVFSKCASKHFHSFVNCYCNDCVGRNHLPVNSLHAYEILYAKNGKIYEEAHITIIAQFEPIVLVQKIGENWVYWINMLVLLINFWYIVYGAVSIKISKDTANKWMWFVAFST